LGGDSSTGRRIVVTRFGNDLCDATDTTVVGRDQGGY